MLKKIVTLFIIIALQSNVLMAYAKKVEVKAMQPFDSLHPPKNFSVMLNEDFEYSDTKVLYKYYNLNGYIYEVIPPKRMKQSASFIFIPTSYTDFSHKTYPLTNVVSKYTTKFALKNFTITSAIIMAIGLVPAVVVSTGYFAVDGAIKNNDGNRLKSSATEVYDKTYLSMGEKGKNLYIYKNQDFLLDIVVIKQQEPNYEYSQAK